MVPLARRLKRVGFRTINWGYHSLFQDIRRHADRFGETLQGLQESAEISRFHILAHSMGSLVVRQALLGANYEKLARIVLLCPPNQGSHVASRFVWTFGWLSKALDQISDRPDSFAKQLPKTLAERYEVGTILATHDFVVAHDSSHLPNTRAWTTVSGLHSSMLFKHQTAELAASFFATGNF